MLDENLPTFLYHPLQNDHPLQSIIYFTASGSEPEPEYIFAHADPNINPAARNRYAVALTNPHAPDIIYGEVVLEPEWAAPSLTAAELRTGGGGAEIEPTGAIVPDTFVIQLYNPDQTVQVKMVPGSWNKADSWEFEMLTQSFKEPGAAQIDRQAATDAATTSSSGQQATLKTSTALRKDTHSPSMYAAAAPDFRPKVMFKWKKDSKLSNKDMTCFHTGKSVGRHKSKEPDITVALYKAGNRDHAVTIYEPNLQRVEVEDRKGLDIVMVLSAEVIRELYLVPRQDMFNLGNNGVGVVGGQKRKSSKPGASSPPPPPLQAHAAPLAAAAASHAVPPSKAASNTSNTTNSSNPKSRADQAAIDAETKRLQNLVLREERERDKQGREREKQEREEQKRIQRMLDAEAYALRKRNEEVERETERLRKLYGVEGQNISPGPQAPVPIGPSISSGGKGKTSAGKANGQTPTPPMAYPYPQVFSSYQQQLDHQQRHGQHPQQQQGQQQQQPPPQPPRPYSTGPSNLAHARPPNGSFWSSSASNHWWNDPAGAGMPPPQQHQQQQQGSTHFSPPPVPQTRPNDQSGYGTSNSGGLFGGLFGRDSGHKMTKKRSI